jgi:hypothetical protein
MEAFKVIPLISTVYLPQLHLYGRVQLHKPCIEIELLRLWLVDAHIGSLRRQLADVLQVFAQLVAQLSELRLAVVFQTEGKCLQTYKMVPQYSS